MASKAARFLHRRGRQLCATMLCATMIFGNIGTTISAAGEKESDPVEFELDRVDLYEAIQNAVQDEVNVIPSLDFDGDMADTYEDILEDDGSLYELTPEIENNDGRDLHLRVFARLGDVALEEAYEITGDEEIIFLLTNKTDKAKKAVIRVGEKETEVITVAPYSEVAATEQEGQAAIHENQIPTAGGAGGLGNGGNGGSGSGSNHQETSAALEESTEEKTPEEPAESEPVIVITPDETKDEQQTETGDGSDVSIVDPDHEADKNNNNDNADVTDGTEADTDNDSSTNTGSDQGTDQGSQNDQNNQDSQGDQGGSADDQQGTENGGNDQTDTNDQNGSDVQTDVGGEASDTPADSSDDGNESEVTVLSAAISHHNTYLVMATPSNADEDEEDEATPSDATPSDAENIIDGALYDAVRVKNHSAVALVVTAAELELEDPSYTAEVEGICTVEVWDKNGALPQGAELHVTELKEDNADTADQYQEAKEALDQSETTYDGMMALDISFTDKDGYEIEPSKEVRVSIRMNRNALPEDADPTTLAVQHLAEDENKETVKVETVADTTDETKGTVNISEDEEADEPVVVAEFGVESFSTFTITWTYGWYSRSLTVKFVDQNGTEIEGYHNDLSIDLDSDNGTVRIGDYAPDIYGYQYKGAYRNSISAQNSFDEIIARWFWGWPYLYYKNSSGSEIELNNGDIALLVYEGGEQPPQPVEEKQKLSHEKYAEIRTDAEGNYDGYDLTLTIAGKIGSTTQKVPLDVIYILDKSGSMDDDFGGKTRRKAAGDAIESLTNSLSASNELDTRFSLVTFSGSRNDEGLNNENNYNDATLAQGWTESAQDIIAQAYPNSNGGTNYEAGLRIANQQLLPTKRTNALTAVVFISDGKPGYYYNTRGQTTGSGSDFNQTALDNAKKAVAAMSADYFFSVSVGNTSADKYLKELYENGTNIVKKDFFSGSNQTALTEAFKQIQGSITTLSCSNVTVEDTLSDNVYLIKTESGDPELRIVITDKNGTVAAESAPGEPLTWHDVTFTAAYDENSKRIIFDFVDNYKLEEGYTYKVVAHIDATEQAYETYRGSNYVYPDTPGVGTGTHGPSEGELENGLFSNAAESAKVTYTYSETESTELYKMPVIQIQPGELIIEKRISGISGTSEEVAEKLVSLMNQLTFKVDMNWKDEKQQTKTGSKSFKLGNMMPQGEENGTYVYKYSIKGLSPDTTYTVTEDTSTAALTGYEVSTVYNPDTAGVNLNSATGVVAKGAVETAVVANTYSNMKSVTVKKLVTGNMADTNAGYEFTYTVNGVAGETFTLKNNEEKTISNIPAGAAVVIKETDGNRNGYTTTVVKTGETDPTSYDDKNGYSVTVNEDMVITFTNEKQINTPTGLFNNTLPYLMMLMLAAFGMAGFTFSSYRRRTRRAEK